MVPLTNSKKCAEKFRDVWNPKLSYKESTVMLFLNDRRQVKFYAEICTGRSSDCPFDLKEALQYALNTQSNYIVIGHNHTSNIAEPSEQDISFTMGLKEWLVPLEIVLIDHIILTKNDYYSFADHDWGNKNDKISA